MNIYKDQHVLLKSSHTMITSDMVDDVITMYIYTNKLSEFNEWVMIDTFMASRGQFNDLSDRLSYLLATYVRRLCEMEAIDARIHDER